MLVGAAFFAAALCWELLFGRVLLEASFPPAVQRIPTSSSGTLQDAPGIEVRGTAVLEAGHHYTIWHEIRGLHPTQARTIYHFEAEPGDPQSRITLTAFSVRFRLGTSHAPHSEERYGRIRYRPQGPGGTTVGVILGDLVPASSGLHRLEMSRYQYGLPEDIPAAARLIGVFLDIAARKLGRTDGPPPDEWILVREAGSPVLQVPLVVLGCGLMLLGFLVPVTAAGKLTVLRGLMILVLFGCMAAFGLYFVWWVPAMPPPIP